MNVSEVVREEGGCWNANLERSVVGCCLVWAALNAVCLRCSLSSDSRCRATWDEFISDAVKVFLGVIQMFGLNLARQREKIVCCVEDFSALQNEVSAFYITRLVLSLSSGRAEMVAYCSAITVLILNKAGCEVYVCTIVLGHWSGATFVHGWDVG